MPPEINTGLPTITGYLISMRGLLFSGCKAPKMMTLLGFIITLVSLSFAYSSDSVEEPQDYRLEDYDAPVPQTLTGATLVDAFAVKKLLEEQSALVIDVIPQHRRPDFLPENQIWIPVEHQGVAGSIWLPDIGYGVLSDITIGYFKDNLQKHTDNKSEHPIVFYCRLDCWMSWNAAKRALEFGYTNVFWFADGLDGWTFEDFKTTALTPEPGKRQ